MANESLLALSVLFIVVAATIFYVGFWPRLRLRSITSKPFPAAWKETVANRLPFFELFPQALKERFENQIKVFLRDKQFIGCAGQEIDDEIRVTIAAQACLLILNRNSNPYRKLNAVLVYPSTFVATRQVRDDLGLVSTTQTAMLGESWSQGKVVLAWDNVEAGARNLSDGQNVVLHEFAHQLDNESGAHNGAPVLSTSGAYQSWAHVLTDEFQRLQKKAARGRKGLIDHYGATNPAEFFAVTTETFFERPQEMYHSHRELFEELASFYKLDPRDWSAPIR